MRAACYEVVDVLEQVLTRLSSFYPPGHFGQTAREYFSSYIESRFTWYRAVYEPLDCGAGGTMVGELSAGGVMEDISQLIAQMVEGLYIGFGLSELDLVKWRADWEKASVSE